SSIKEIKVDHGEVEGLRVLSSTVDKASISDESIVREWNIESSHVNRISLNNAEIHKCLIQASHAVDCKMEKSYLNGVILKMLKVDGLSISQSRLNDVVIVGQKDKFWKHSGMIDVQFENVKLNKTINSGCRWKRVKI